MTTMGEHKRGKGNKEASSEISCSIYNREINEKVSVCVCVRPRAPESLRRVVCDGFGAVISGVLAVHVTGETGHHEAPGSRVVHGVKPHPDKLAESRT